MVILISGYSLQKPVGQALDEQQRLAVGVAADHLDANGFGVDGVVFVIVGMGR